jgi:hypothetical protein
VRIIRVLRIARLLRIIRIAGIVRFIHALRTFIYSILATLRSLVWAMVLLFLIVYVFGVFFTQRAHDFLTDPLLLAGFENDEIKSVANVRYYWGNLWASMHTLFKAITNGVSWDVAVAPFELFVDGGLVEVFVFLFYISFTVFAVMNVVTGIFCQSAIQTAQESQDLIVQQQLASKNKFIARVKAVFEEIDEDGSGCITLGELEKYMENEHLKDVFETLDVRMEDAWTLFKLLDIDGGNEIDATEFINGVVRLKGNAKRADLVETNSLLRKILMGTKELSVVLRNVDNQVSRVKPVRCITQAPQHDSIFYC